MQHLDRAESDRRPIFLLCALLVAGVLFFVGRGFGQNAGSAAPTPQYAHDMHDAEDLRQSVKDMAEDLLRNIGMGNNRSGSMDEGLLVCTFVELKKLYRTSSFGRYLAEQLMSEFQQRQFRVVEMRQSREVLVKERYGEYGLSRDPEAMRQEVAAGAMLTGTYVATADNIIINARIIDNRSAALLSSATMILPRNRLTEELLADAATAPTRPREPLYMKRLEL